MTIVDVTAVVRGRFAVRVARNATAWARSALHGLLDALRREIRSRKAERALEAMSDRALNDIGVARGEIRHRVRSTARTGRYTVIGNG